MTSTDFCCSDCDESFKYASQLLIHFALHASQNQNIVISSFLDKSKNNISTELSNCSFTGKLFKNVKSNVPDLYPINGVKKFNLKNNKTSNLVTVKCEPKLLNENSTTQSVINENKCLSNYSEQDEFCPLKYCAVTMEDSKQNISHMPNNSKLKLFSNNSTKSTKFSFNLQKKKYECSICFKSFGWSTDLKRHTLTHTGERPFKCNLCDACFTRNFLLQNHISKIHLNKNCKNSTKNKVTMPNLKPINKNQTLKVNSCKQDKKKGSIFKSTSSSLENFKLQKFNMMNLVDKGTLVQ